MFGLFDYLFAAASFMPHGYCLLWRPDLVAMHAVADAVIAISYFSIPAVIHIFLMRRPDIEYGWLAFLFVAFISACGMTHVIGLVTLWHPVYGLEGLVKLATAAISLATAASMWPLLPKALAVPGPAQLREANALLQAEILQREQAEFGLRQAHQQLEGRVDERTRQLQVANDRLAALNVDYQRALLRLESILDNTVDALSTINAVGEVEDYNLACERIFGYTADEVVGENIKMLMNPIDAGRHDGYLEAYLTSGTAKIIGIGREVEGRRKDGSPVALELSVGEIRLGEGYRLFSGLMRDVTERKEAEAQRGDLIVQLRRSNQELEQFAYIASHDLRAPLRALSILPNWIRRDLDQAGGASPAISEHLSDMNTQVKRMDRLLTDLLEYSRIGRTRGSEVTIDPRQSVENVCDLVRPPSSFEVIVEGELPPVMAIPTEFELVMRNLISNALKHHDRNEGRIVIRGGKVEGGIWFEVSDDGPGIAAQHHERIFEMFSTLRSRDEVEGSGMGLALIKKIVERWGGRVSIASDPQERGATFRFTMPVASAREAA
jgi:PAS domain S-box-containing protein